MFATIFAQEINTSGNDGIFSRYASLCVGRKVHVARAMECKCANDGREIVLACEYSVVGPCDGHCQKHEQIMLPDGAARRVREFLAAQGKGDMRLRKGIVFDYAFCGCDLHIWQICLHGLVHISRSRDATGMPTDYSGIDACDGSCKPRRIRLPPGAVKLVRKAFPALFPQPEAEAVAESA